MTTLQDLLVYKAVAGGGGGTLITKNITTNGTYNAFSDNADGYSSVTVNVPDYEVYKQAVEQSLTGEVVMNGVSKIKENIITGLPNITKFSTDTAVILNNNFMSVRDLTECYFPNLLQTNNYSFYVAGSLQKIDFGALTRIGGGGQFDSVASLDTIIIRTNAVCTMAAKLNSASKYANGTGYFYVPKSLLNDYSIASNWADYWDTEQIRAIEDYPEITGG